MGSKSKAPSYQAASYNTGGLFGNSTTDKSGTSFDPTKWETKTMKTVGKYMNPTLKSLVNNDFMNDANFLRYQDKFTNDMNKIYDTSVLSNLAGRGLMRSSGLQGATNAFADTLAQNQLNLYDNYRNNLLNNLSALQGTGNTIYNYLTGINSGSMNQANSLNSYNLDKARLDAQSSDTFSQIANSVGSLSPLAGAVMKPFSKQTTTSTNSMPSAQGGSNSALSDAIMQAAPMLLAL